GNFDHCRGIVIAVQSAIADSLQRFSNTSTSSGSIHNADYIRFFTYQCQFRHNE
ncbi:hypothetical protein HAX54_041186, partial [Datura stramonium]|nr:hypothetical protein [Datura stramonium]